MRFIAGALIFLRLCFPSFLGASPAGPSDDFLLLPHTLKAEIMAWLRPPSLLNLYRAYDGAKPQPFIATVKDVAFLLPSGLVE